MKNVDNFDTLKMIDDIKGKFLKEYNSFSKVEKEKFQRFDNASGGFLGEFIGLKTSRVYGDLPRETVFDVFLKSDVKKDIDKMKGVKEESLKDFLKLVDTQNFKDYENGFLETNKKYREMTQGCVNHEDFKTAFKLMETMKDKVDKLFNNNEKLTSFDMFEKLTKDNKDLMEDVLSDVPGGEDFLNKVKTLGFYESVSQKMNKGLDRMVEFCDNPIDVQAMEKGRKSTRQNRLY